MPKLTELLGDVLSATVEVHSPNLGLSFRLKSPSWRDMEPVRDMDREMFKNARMLHDQETGRATPDFAGVNAGVVIDHATKRSAAALMATVTHINGQPVEDSSFDEYATLAHRMGDMDPVVQKANEMTSARRPNEDENPTNG